jgi:hypothetical protein
MKNKLNGLAVSTAAFLSAVPVAFAQNTTVSEIATPEFFFTDIGELINKALTFVMVLGALLVFMYLIWGGIEWITSGGDKAGTESARNKITAAVVGLIILAASWAILGLVLKFLGAGDINSLIEQL